MPPAFEIFCVPLHSTRQKNYDLQPHEISFGSKLMSFWKLLFLLVDFDFFFHIPSTHTLINDLTYFHFITWLLLQMRYWSNLAQSFFIRFYWGVFRKIAYFLAEFSTSEILRDLALFPVSRHILVRGYTFCYRSFFQSSTGML